MELEFEVVEWGTMLVAIRSAPSTPQAMGVDAINSSLSFTDPSTLYRYYHSESLLAKLELGPLEERGSRQADDGGADGVRHREAG